MTETLDTSRIDEACRAEITDGLLGCQVAVAFDRKVIWSASYGAVADDTRFWIASATKPILSSSLLLLIGEGALDVGRPVAHYIPEFGENGKEAVTVEQVFLMTCGFPGAPMPPSEGGDPQRRRARLASWRLEWEPGSRFEYHPMSAHWVLAELIERITGGDFCDFLEERVTRPLGLPRLLGIPRAEQGGLAQALPEASPEVRDQYDYATKIEVGEPGGGGFTDASTLARFYQGLLHDPQGLWDPAVLADGLGNVRCTLPDPLMKMPANRTLAVVVGAGFGTTWVASPTAFGWPGAGGQIAFAEPATGVSFAFLQVGDTKEMSQFVRGTRMSSLALELGR